jgi:two-component system, NtrC family, sensor kinase
MNAKPVEASAALKPQAPPQSVAPPRGPNHDGDAPTVRLLDARTAPTSMWRRILLTSLVFSSAILSIGLLWFLYQKNQGVSPAIRASTEAQLRELRQLDSEWNVDILRSKVGLNGSYDAIVTPLHRIVAGMDTLMAAPVSASAPIQKQVDAMRKVFADKADAVDAFKSHNSILRNSLRYLPTAATEAKSMLGSLGGSVATGVDKELTGTLSEALKYAVVTDDAQRYQLTERTQALDASAVDLPDASAALNATTVFLNHVRTLLKQKSNEQDMLSAIAAVPTVVAINQAAAAFDTAFAQQASTADFWRTALFGYSALLLALVAFIGWRLRQSYVEINRVNAALVAVNDGLELRVQARTSELAHALKSLRESEAQLVQSEKMSSLGQMIAGVAHEINTPLAYVRSSLETVEEQLSEVDDLVRHSSTLLAQMASPEPHPEQLSDSFAALSALTASFSDNAIVQELRKLSKDGLYGIDQISEIVTNLRNFSRLDRSKTTQFDLREGLDSTLVIARSAVKQHQIVKKFSEIPSIECSPSQLNQVFLNLITNAAQALPEEGGIITLSTAVDGDRVRVVIADNGSGIAPAHLEKIFDPFFTTKEIGKGTGLGLSIVYKIIQEHAGTIAVKSIAGRGTQFSIHLPISTPTVASKSSL